MPSRELQTLARRARAPGLVPAGRDRLSIHRTGRPWQNPYVESFHARVRDELLDVEQFSGQAEAQVVIADWRHGYSQHRPHSSLGMRPPVVYTAAITTTVDMCDANPAWEKPTSVPRERHRPTHSSDPSSASHPNSSILLRKITCSAASPAA